MTTKNQTNGWAAFRKQARSHAGRLEKQAATAKLVAMADGPLEALATLSDVAALERHTEDARTARLHGRVAPPPPVPVSSLMRGFNQQLRDKCVAVATLLRPEEIRRLASMRAGFADAMETNDLGVMLLVRDLLPREPQAIVQWIRTHLATLERRFAS